MVDAFLSSYERFVKAKCAPTKVLHQREIIVPRAKMQLLPARHPVNILHHVPAYVEASEERHGRVFEVRPRSRNLISERAQKLMRERGISMEKVIARYPGRSLIREPDIAAMSSSPIAKKRRQPKK